MCMVLFANFCLRNDAGRVLLFSSGRTGYGFPVGYTEDVRMVVGRLALTKL